MYVAVHDKERGYINILPYFDKSSSDVLFVSLIFEWNQSY